VVPWRFPLRPLRLCAQPVSFFSFLLNPKSRVELRCARSAGFPACGFWRLSSRQFPHGNTGLESPVNPQTGMSALPPLASAAPQATSGFGFKPDQGSRRAAEDAENKTMGLLRVSPRPLRLRVYFQFWHILPCHPHPHPHPYPRVVVLVAAPAALCSFVANFGFHSRCPGLATDRLAGNLAAAGLRHSRAPRNENCCPASHGA